MALQATLVGAVCCLALCLGQEPVTDEVPVPVPGNFLTPDDFNFENPAEISDVNDVDPTLNEERYEGDIVLNKEDKEMLAQEAPMDGPRSAVLDDNRKWADHQIPYELGSTFTPVERGTIAAAIKKFHSRTCLRFVPHTEQQDYIVIRLGDENASAVGRIGGRQDVTLKQEVYLGIVAHELMHAVGFWHEHSRHDRDDFIKINWENIVPGMEHNFMKHEAKTVSNLGVGYDLGSIMHFGPKAFTINANQDTIEVIGGGLIGQRKDLSKMDVEKINKLYECPPAVTRRR